MQYLLMLFSEEGGWNQLTKEQQDQGMLRTELTQKPCRRRAC